MNEISIGLVVVLLLLLCLSAFFSSMETAFSSANKIRLKNYADEDKKGARKAYDIIKNFDHALSTILIGNNLVNIAAATISAKIAADLFGGSTGLVISTILMTVLVLIFGEVLPKSFAKEHAEAFALRISGCLLLLMAIFQPLTWLLVKLKTTLASFIKTKQSYPSITEEELKEMINISEEEGVIGNDERELVQNSLDFNDITVAEILTPRTQMVAIELTMSLDEISSILLEERFSRVPVYDGTIDNIVGILSERDFLRSLVQKKQPTIEALLRKPLYVYETMGIAQLLPQLQKNRVHMAIVIDEFGGTSGLITLEDILEELVGEIWDEHDEKVREMVQIDENVFEFNGDFPLDEFERVMGFSLPTRHYQTLGGWVIEEFQRIPEENEEIEYKHVHIVITEAEERRIKKIKVIVKEEGVHQ
ncbi:hemolysin family protein [Alkalihalobacterium bogoriense]|uniref:hemolysin family protein n=1 Tax=Alkalihalobacterium bogoriense TaxID=246272 RepID=UPI00047B8937|nr:hemolysin family protein [Alkalihalobacterium bogoriense]